MRKALKASIAVALSISCVWPTAAWAAIGDISEMQSDATDSEAAQVDQNASEAGTNDSFDTPITDVEQRDASASSSVQESAEAVAADNFDSLNDSLATEDISALDIVRNGWVNENGKTYFYANRSMVKGWLVTTLRPNGGAGELERYWLNPSTGELTKGLINAGGGCWAYGKPDGSVVRGKYVGTGNYHYFADNDGRLWNPGWHVTGQFTGGWLERYYIDANAHAAVPGTSSDGWRHYTRADGGFVARGRLNFPDGRVLFADNDGRIPNAGWNVTSAYGQGLQRYYMDYDGGTHVGFFRVNGSAYYAYPNVGYVLRGKAHISGNGWTQIFLADNDGKLADYEGWLVTGKYDGGSLQRYRLDSAVAPGFYGAHLGYFAIGSNGYYGREDHGYVVRGYYRAPNGSTWHADNDGAMPIVKTTNDPELNNILSIILTQHGRDLRSLFNYVASYRYINGSLYPSGNWSVPFAKEMYKNGGGNCYRYAALFCELARAAGYNANVVSGYVPSRSQGWAPHGWVEIYMNGTTYVCDPDMAHEVAGRNWYMFTYGNAPINYRK